MKAKKGKVFYAHLPSGTMPHAEDIDFVQIQSNKQHDWLGTTGTDFSELYPLIDQVGEGIFLEAMSGLPLVAPKWTVSYGKKLLSMQMEQFIVLYNMGYGEKSDGKESSPLKWDKRLKALFDKKTKLTWTPNQYVSFYRQAFNKEYVYAHAAFHGWGSRWDHVVDWQKKLPCLVVRQPDSRLPFEAVAVSSAFSSRILLKSVGYPYRLPNKDGKLQENISDWALTLFTSRYAPKEESSSQIAVSSNNLSNLHTIVQLLIKYSRDLPVLYKYTLRIFDTLPKRQQTHTTVEDLQLIRKTIKEFAHKTAILGKDAKERKRLFIGVSDNLKALSNALDIIEKDRIQLEKRRQALTKENIFFYVYAVLQEPKYREKYAEDLARELPRIPLYPNFWQWADWGRELYQTHTSETKKEDWPFEVVTLPEDSEQEALASLTNPTGLASAASSKKKQARHHLILKAEPLTKEIQVDECTTLTKIPREAWAFHFDGQEVLPMALQQLRKYYQTVLAAYPSEELPEAIKMLKPYIFKEIARLVELCTQTIRIQKEMAV